MTDIPADYDASLTSRRNDLRTLSACGKEFARHRSPQLIGPAILVVAGARVKTGRWSWHDALIPPALLASQPFLEWIIHKYLLHLPPFEIAGRKHELISAGQHRRHHLDPSDLDRVLLTGGEASVFLSQIAATSAGIALALGKLVGTPFLPLALTTTGCSYLGLFRYEWSHFLIHTPYVPKSKWYRTVWRNHRLHHYKHEGYWLGITSNLGDRVLHTNPNARDVERSETARTLGQPV